LGSEPVLLRLGCSGNTVVSAASSVPDSAGSVLEGQPLGDLFGETDLDETYRLAEMRLDGRTVTCAARRDAEGSLYVYYFEDPGICPAQPSVPAARLVPGSRLPVVSPGLVALLGYTPWELAQSDLFEQLAARPAGVPGMMALTDRHGRGLSVVCTSYASRGGCMDIFLVPLPPDDSPSLFSLIGRWEQMPLASPDELLAFLLDALGVSRGAVLSVADGEPSVLASRNMELDLEEGAQRELMETVSSSTPVWVDTDGLFEDGGDGEHVLLYPFGRNRSYIFAAPFHGEAVGFHQKADVLLPVMSMRLDLWDLASEREAAAVPAEPPAASEAHVPAFPGTSLYSGEGLVLGWSHWMERSTGVSAASAVGQPAGRLLDRIGSEKLGLQYEFALKGVFLGEPVEFFSPDGVPVYSYMAEAPRGISHTVADSGELELGAAVSPSPGTWATAGNQASVAEALADAVRITRWEYDMSGAAAGSGTRTWLSHRTVTETMVQLMRLLAPFCPDRWAGLDTTVIDEDVPGRLFLPGSYHVLRFRVLPVLMPAQLVLLERIRMQLRSLGCALVHTEEEDALQVAVPEALEAGRNMDVVVYSSDSHFLGQCERTLPSAADTWHISESPSEASRLQRKTLAMILRLRPDELPLVPAFVSRLPSQPMLVASGSMSGASPMGSCAELLQLPVEEKQLLVALRRLLRR